MCVDSDVVIWCDFTSGIIGDRTFALLYATLLVVRYAAMACECANGFEIKVE